MTQLPGLHPHLPVTGTSRGESPRVVDEVEEAIDGDPKRRLPPRVVHASLVHSLGVRGAASPRYTRGAYTVARLSTGRERLEAVVELKAVFLIVVG